MPKEGDTIHDTIVGRDVEVLWTLEAPNWNCLLIWVDDNGSHYGRSSTYFSWPRT